MATEFMSPVGRIVQGDVLKGNTHDRKGQPIIVKTGPNKGQQTTNYFMALAVPKMVQNDQGQMVPNPDVAAFYNILLQEARRGYPQFFDAAGNCTHPRFTFKMSDGDGKDNDGKNNAEKEGWAGHYVFKFSSSFPPKLVHQGQLINEPGYVKRGDYVRVVGNCAPNIGSDVPGLYLNHSAVELVGYGQEIRGGIDAVGAFAQAGAAALPAGASAVPLAPPGGGGIAGPNTMGVPQMPGMPGMAQPQMPAMGQPQMPGIPGMTPPGGAPQMPAMTPPSGVPQMPVMQAPAPVAAPQMPGMPAPNHGFVANAMGQPPQQPQMPGMPAMTPPGGAPQMPGMPIPVPPAPAALKPTAAAGAFTLEQWRAQGYTDDQLISHGIFTR